LVRVRLLSALSADFKYIVICLKIDSNQKTSKFYHLKGKQSVLGLPLSPNPFSHLERRGTGEFAPLSHFWERGWG